MTISLIVCTVGRTEPLQRLLTSLRGLTMPPLEIIVVDQNPAGFLDAVLAQNSELPIVHSRSVRGLSRARNVGIKQAAGTIIGFPDDDCWYPPGVLARVDAFFADNTATGLLTGRTTDATGATSVSPQLDTSAAITRDDVFKAGNSNGVFVKRDLALAIGGFDETLGVGADSPFQSGEETDFLLRCLKTGTSCYFEHNIVIYHEQANQTVANYITRVGYYSAGFGRVLRLHDFGMMFVAEKLSRACMMSLICLARGDIQGAKIRQAWVRGTLRGFTAAK